MSTITPKERSEWRAMCTPAGFDFEEKILRLLDALEAEEGKNRGMANQHKAMQVEWNQMRIRSDHFEAKAIEMQALAKRAESIQDVLVNNP